MKKRDSHTKTAKKAIFKGFFVLLAVLAIYQLASFALAQAQAATFTLTVSKNGSGTGFVQTAGLEITCGTTCSASFPAGTNVTLIEGVDPGSIFAGFTGCDSEDTAGCHVTVNSNRTVTVTYGSEALIPTAPSNVHGYGLSLNEIEVFVTKTSNNEEGIDIERSTSPTSGFVRMNRFSTQGILAGSEFNIPDSGPFTPGTTYYYRADAFNTTNTSPYSNLASILIPLPPAAPTNLSVKKVYPQEVDLSWTDNATTEDDYVVERSTSSTGPFTQIAMFGPNQTFYPSTKLNPNTLYYFRVRAHNPGGYSTASNVVSTTTLALPAITDTQADWVVVITNRGTALPQAAVNTFCDTSSTGMLGVVGNWMKREANKYGAARPFKSLTCVSGQISIPSSLWTPGSAVEGTTEPLNQDGVITYLETNTAVPLATRTAVQNAKFVSVLNYVPTSMDFIDNAVGSKYSFLYLFPFPTGTDASTATSFDPELSVDVHARILGHELMHNLGATDKYGSATATCTTDPITGQQYTGYDIMCHREPAPFYASGAFGGGYTFPPLPDLIVSEGTARETPWLNLYHPADVNKDFHINITEMGNYITCWQTGCSWPTLPSPVPINYMGSAVTIWQGGEIYHYDATKTCPDCFTVGL